MENRNNLSKLEDKDIIYLYSPKIKFSSFLNVFKKQKLKKKSISMSNLEGCIENIKVIKKFNY